MQVCYTCRFTYKLQNPKKKHFSNQKVYFIFFTTLLSTFAVRLSCTGKIKTSNVTEVLVLLYKKMNSVEINIRILEKIEEEKYLNSCVTSYKNVFVILFL